MKHWLLYYFAFGATTGIHAQKQTADSTEYAHFDCAIMRTRQKPGAHSFASAPAIQLRVNNDEYVYTKFQLGKRKNKLYLYLKILADNVCIKKDENVDLHFRSGEIMTLANRYPLNCDALFVRQLKKKELRKIKENQIALIRIYTYKKNYEMYVSEIQNHEIHHSIDCLSEYKITKAEKTELNIKDNMETMKENEPATSTEP